ncbi:hypothetical protein F6455_04685 [Proteobacteria bacterium 005FR1]|nr:hypothetical protein [Proteobacteria bacterium 005FR1]
MYRERIWRRVGAASAVALSLALGACGTFQNDSQRLRAPNYASPVGANNWEVKCGRDVILIDDDSLDDFYNADGTVKTYIEFCQEAQPSLIKDRNR